MQTDKKLRYKSLSRQIIAKVSLITLGVSLLFILLNFMFLFVVEDVFLERSLARSEAKIAAHYQSTGQWVQPLDPNMVLYPTKEQLPVALKQVINQADFEADERPRMAEYFGLDERHYHVAFMQGGAVLVFETSSQLLIRPMRKGILITYGLMTLLALVLAAGLTYHTTKKSIQPLSQLTGIISDYRPEDLPRGFASVYPANEIGILAHSLEQSVARITQFIEREQQFSRDLSHDLRTPLAVTSGAIELLADQQNLGEKQAELVSRIQGANTHMLLTINGLLAMAQEQTDSPKQQQKLCPVIERTIIQYADLIKDKPVEVQVTVDAAAFVMARDGVVDILLSNIVGNAFHYTQKGSIKIDYGKQGLVITDTAGGIPEALKQSVLEKNVKSKNSSGYGLGLSIVKRLCDYHQIDFSIDHLTGGTAITLDFGH